tara:strand:+ start:64 stop:456 length:393 start_codon:yes stop_codon:yes gene_type:complete
LNLKLGLDLLTIFIGKKLTTDDFVNYETYLKDVIINDFNDEGLEYEVINNIKDKFNNTVIVFKVKTEIDTAYIMLTHPLESPYLRFIDVFNQLEREKDFSIDKLYNLNYLTAIKNPLSIIKTIQTDVSSG